MEKSQNISNFCNDTTWIKSEISNDEFGSNIENVNCTEEIYVKIEPKYETDSTSSNPKIEDFELNSQKEQKGPKDTSFKEKWLNCIYCEYHSKYKSALVRHKRAKHNSDKSERVKTQIQICQPLLSR